MKKTNVKSLAISAIIAALYVALTWLLAPISYGPIQFRVSEILVLLVFLNPKYAYSLAIGCLIANTTSSFGWYDIVFGTIATIVALIPMTKSKNIFIAAIFPVVSNAIIISVELLLIYNEPHLFLFNVLTIGLGEAIVLFLLGIPVVKLLCKNETIVELLEVLKK